MTIATDTQRAHLVEALDHSNVQLTQARRQMDVERTAHAITKARLMQEIGVLEVQNRELNQEITNAQHEMKHLKEQLDLTAKTIEAARLRREEGAHDE